MKMKGGGRSRGGVNGVASVERRRQRRKMTAMFGGGRATTMRFRRWQRLDGYGGSVFEWGWQIRLLWMTWWLLKLRAAAMRFRRWQRLDGYGGSVFEWVCRGERGWR
ncbi:hypothetical protein PIB30_077010 [Stylosanthes scabra]|uniref:Uncharacterized protein n=1 Tax=Stylosanthes scabra TaxID=79078 RepID=A0ABU6QR04_9FABA|nr:hypothetical protein [Stylosanthes scabra]